MEPISLILGGILLLIFVIGWIKLYLFPFGIAAKRGHPQLRVLFYVNLFLGWTVFGWLVVLVCALSYEAQEYTPRRKPQIFRKSVPVQPIEVTNDKYDSI